MNTPSISQAIADEAAKTPTVRAANIARAVINITDLKERRDAQLSAQNKQIEQQLKSLRSAMDSEEAKTVLGEKYAAVKAEVDAL